MDFHARLQLELAFGIQAAVLVRLVTKSGKLLEITKQPDLFTLRFTRRLYNTPFVCLWIDFILWAAGTDGKHTAHQKLEVFSSTKLIGEWFERLSNGLSSLCDALKDFHFEGAIQIREELLHGNQFAS